MNEFDQFKNDLKKHHEAILDLMERMEAEAQRGGHSDILSVIQSGKTTADEKLKNLLERSNLLQVSLNSRVQRLEREIDVLNKTKDTLASNNILLEYKRNDLLQLTSKLEEANQEISSKNHELLEQKQQISQQAEVLNNIHKEILEKHEELERQKEALLDQSDYLHEANQSITFMHQEVEKQKDQILQKNEELLSLNNEKNNLIGIVAHDLKSPLNQMKGLLNIIRLNAAGFDAETASCLNMMEESADRLHNLIGKILDVEALESQKSNLVLEKLNLSDILTDLVERYELYGQQKSITLHAAIPESLHVVADKVYIIQVFENLISNAIKFSPSRRNVFVRLSCTQEEIVTEVADEGPGLTEEDKKKLFGKYQKLSARPTGNEISTGLGLSIVKKFVDAMNARIWCESEAGKGAHFFVAFKIPQGNP
jgi:signal transduction histidine kinase